MTTTDTAVQALSDAQLREICTNAWGNGGPGTLVRIARAAIAADRALRAPPVLAPTFAQLNSACMSYRHDFGLMSDEEQERLRWLAKEWLHAWRKEAAFAAAPPAPKEAPAGAPINQPEAERAAFELAFEHITHPGWKTSKHLAWMVWQTRAALAATPPAV